MSEWNYIYDSQKQMIGVFRHGVAWRKNPYERLGEYSKSQIYSNTGATLASINGNEVVSQNGIVLGNVIPTEKEHSFMLSVGGKVVGRCLGFKEVGAAAIVFLGKELEQSCP